VFYTDLLPRIEFSFTPAPASTRGSHQIIFITGFGAFAASNSAISGETSKANPKSDPAEPNRHQNSTLKYNNHVSHLQNSLRPVENQSAQLGIKRNFR